MRSVASRIRGPEAIVLKPDRLLVYASHLTDADMSIPLLRGFSDGTIDLAYRAMRRLTFYFPGDTRYVAWQRRVLDEKDRRGKPSGYDLKMMYMTYVDARMFADAGRLREQFPSMTFPAVPEVIISTGLASSSRWRAYAVSEGGKVAELQSLPLAHGSRVIVVMLTSCAAAEQAMTDILGEKEFAERFRAHGLLLTERFDSQGLAMWKSHFALDAAYIADKASDFPGFDFRSSPHFYFVKDGSIVSQFDGWGKGPGYDTRALLRDGFKAINL